MAGRGGSSVDFSEFSWGSDWDRFTFGQKEGTVNMGNS